MRKRVVLRASMSHDGPHQCVLYQPIATLAAQSAVRPLFGALARALADAHQISICTARASFVTSPRLAMDYQPRYQPRIASLLPGWQRAGNALPAIMLVTSLVPRLAMLQCNGSIPVTFSRWGARQEEVPASVSFDQV